MKKRGIMITLISIVAGGMLLGGCYRDNEEELYPSGTCNTSTVTYSAVIRPIIQNNCAMSGCHDNGTVSGGYQLTDYAGLKLIVDNNRLLGTINHLNGYSAMPKNVQKMPQCTLDQIAKWVADGALNN